MFSSSFSVSTRISVAMFRAREESDAVYAET
jgi:hypothetical protein